MEIFLRVIADTDDTVLKEMRIKGSASMLSLHEHIFTSFGLLPGEMGSFFESTPVWDQGAELPMFAMEEDSESMENLTVEAFFQRSNHALYVYNFLDMNIFYVEKTRVDEEEGFEDFVILSSVGELPVQEAIAPESPAAAGKNPEAMSEAELNEIYGLEDLDAGKLPGEEDDQDDSYEEGPYY